MCDSGRGTRSRRGPSRPVPGGWAELIAQIRKVAPFGHLVLAVLVSVGLVAIHLQNLRKPIHSVLRSWYTPLYYPLLNLALMACGLIILGRGIQFLRARFHSPDPTLDQADPDSGEKQNHGPPKQEQTPPLLAPGRTLPRLWVRLTRSTRVLHVSILLFLLPVSWGLLSAFREKANPTHACVGSDYVTFLGNIVATGLERWEIYNPAKRLPYSWLAATWAHLSGTSYLEAGQAVSFLAVSLLPAATYLMATPVTGPLTALLAALLVLAIPLVHPFAIQTGSYGLFFLVVTLCLAAGTRAASSGRTRHFLMMGIVAACCIQVQAKGVVTVIPVGVAALLAARPFTARTTLTRVVAWALPLAVSSALIHLFPVSYPSLGSMVAINRQEVHRDMPYSWPRTREPDPEFPSPVSRFLPEFMRGGELENFAAVVLAPPDQNAGRVTRRRAGDRWEVEVSPIPDTTIPPLAVRVRGNLRVLGDRFDGLSTLLALLALVGTLALPWPRSDRSGRRHAAAWVVLAGIVPLWGPLSLNFHTRYLVPVLPPAAVLVVHGTRTLLRIFIRIDHPLIRAAESLLASWFIGSLAVSLFTTSHTLWLKPGLDLSSLPGYLGVADLESHVNRSIAIQRVSEWVTTNLPADARVFDCTALGIYLLEPGDPRWANGFENGRDRDARCRRIAMDPPGGTGPLYLIASDTHEFRGPDTLGTEILQARSGSWRPVFAIEPETLHTLETGIDPGELHEPIIVFQAQGRSRL